MTYRQRNHDSFSLYLAMSLPSRGHYPNRKLLKKNWTDKLFGRRSKFWKKALNLCSHNPLVSALTASLMSASMCFSDSICVNPLPVECSASLTASSSVCISETAQVCASVSVSYVPSLFISQSVPDLSVSKFSEFCIRDVDQFVGQQGALVSGSGLSIPVSVFAPSVSVCGVSIADNDHVYRVDPRLAQGNHFDDRVSLTASASALGSSTARSVPLPPPAVMHRQMASSIEASLALLRTSIAAQQDAAAGLERSTAPATDPIQNVIFLCGCHTFENNLVGNLFLRKLKPSSKD
nr:uncharacterized protein LOC109163356 [Ipomoea batatas]